MLTVPSKVCASLVFAATIALVHCFQYDYHFGSTGFTCIPGWVQLGDSCFAVTNERLPWNASKALCASSRYNNSNELVIHNWFLARDLSEKLTSKETSFWTGFYHEPHAERSLLNSTGYPNSISIYNPLWASTEPQLNATSKSRQCLAFHAQFSDDLNYGWHAKNCSKPLPTVCQTFACLQGNEYRCEDNSRCYPVEGRCDGIQDCADNSDEDPETVCKNQAACKDIVLEQSQGEIFLPHNYKLGSECRWTIRQRQATRIKLTMLDMDINEHDLLTIGGVSSDSEPRWDRLRPKPWSNHTSQQWISTSNTVVVAFKSASKGIGAPLKGFHFRYSIQEKPNCIETLAAWNGTLVIPKLDSGDASYAPDLNCHWTLTNERNNIISIQIAFFSLASGDRLTVFDGSVEDGNLMGVFTEEEPPPTSFTSTSSLLNLLFTSQPHSSGARGFHIHYRQGCMNERLTANSGELETPGARIPGNRKPFRCSYIIQIPCKRVIDCPFSMFFHKLKMSHGDAISIESGSRVLKLSARSPPITRFRAPSSRVVLNIQSNSANLVFISSFSRDCQPLQLNGSMLAIYSHTNEYNSMAQMSCKTGLTLMGNRTLQCTRNGVWSADTPVCRVTFCPMPFMRNGFLLNITGFQVHSSLYYGCQLGFEPASKGVAICMGNAAWSPIPSCKPIDCGQPDVVYKGADLIDLSMATAALSLATYLCPADMTLAGAEAPYRICELNGRWSEPKFQCRAPICYAMPVAFGNFSHLWFPSGSLGVYTCESGFVPDSPFPKCENGSWSLIPQCKSENLCAQNSCGKGTCLQLNGSYTCICEPGYYAVSLNGTTTCEDIDECSTSGHSLCDQNCHNTPGSYYCSCNNGFWLYGNVSVDFTYITVNQKYLVLDHSCIAKRCPTPGVPTGSYELPYRSDSTMIYINNGLYTIGFIIEFQCKLDGSVIQFTCLSDSTWHKNGSCPAKGCLLPPSVHSKLSVEPHRKSYAHGDVLHFSCSPPYSLVGPSKTKCQPNNLWDVKRFSTCAGQQCSEITFNGDRLVGTHNSSVPRNSPGYRYMLMCDSGFEFDSGELSVIVECTDSLLWNRTNIPLCIPKTCTVKKKNGAVPRKSKLLVGESTSFTCLENDYRLSGSPESTCVAHGSMRARYVGDRHEECIDHISSETYTSPGASATLWCVVNERCADMTVSWRRSKPTGEDIVTIRRGLFKYAVLFEKTQIADQGSYKCVVSYHGKVVDERSADLFFHSPNGTADSWMNLMDKAKSIEEIMLDDTISSGGWNASDDWEQNEDGTWMYRHKSGSNFLINTLRGVAPPGTSIVVRYRIEHCESCKLELKLLFVPKTHAHSPIVSIDIRQFVVVGELISSATSLRMQPNAGSFLALAIESNASQAQVISVDVFFTACPQIQIGLVQFAQTVSQQSMVEVAGECVAGASTYDGSQPTLSCSPQGKWISSQQLISTCLCRRSHSAYHDRCVPQGPICYECSNGTDCNETWATHCAVDEACYTSTSRRSDGTLSVTKGCASECVSDVDQFEECLRGERSCRLCCVSDYCNWSPHSAVELQLKGDTPVCIDTRASSVQCTHQIVALKHDDSFVEPVSIPFPVVRDNDPYYTISSNLPDIGSEPYAFDGAVDQLEWNVTDRHGEWKTCTTRIVYEDHWAPRLQCPEIHEDFMANTTSSIVSARLPEVKWTDVSDVHLMYDVRNGTQLPIDEPLRVTVTAVDQHGNVAKCAFWYIARVSDCPLWLINQKEYKCNGSMEQRSCTRKVQCESELLPDTNSIVCAAGSGWTIAPSGVDPNQNMTRLNRSPVCIPTTRSTVRLSVQTKLEFGDNKCASPVANQIYGKLLNITRQICANTSWQRSEYLTKGSILTVLFIARNTDVSAAVDCAEQFVFDVDTGFIAKDACEDLVVVWQSANYSVHRDEDKCPSGYSQRSDGCKPCPEGTYSDRSGVHHCIYCPYGRSTVGKGAFSASLCYEYCSMGFYSISGLAPCRACPQGFYQTRDASKSCIQCPGASTTSSTGSSAASHCAERCKPGWFSETGLQPCTGCPFGFYQPNTGKTKCLRCPKGTVTLQHSATTLLQCRRLVCGDGWCKNGAKCEDKECKCALGYVGSDCGVAVNLCLAGFCLNGARCSFDSNSTQCQCPNGFDGPRCEHHIEITPKSLIPPSPCANTSLCSNGLCLSTGHSYICECNEGYTNAPPSKQLCVLMDSCHFQPCNTAICPNTSTNALECFPHSVSVSKAAYCRNNGTQTTMGNCLCPPKYYGSHCDQRYADVCKQVESGGYCNRGKCHEFSNQFNLYYFCDCDKGSFGESCDISAPCSEVKCNFGTCEAKGPTSASCKCNVGFQGPNCTAIVDTCRSNPCIHGTCLSAAKSYFCLCPQQYIGERCETPISPCTKNACAESGQCTAISMGPHGQFNCTCPIGWAGQRCTEHRGSCAASKCSNGSTCIDILSGNQACSCPPNRKGPLCDIPVRFCQVLNPCFNNATCIDVPWGYQCSCSPGYTGKNCESIVDHCEPNPCLNEGFCQNDHLGYSCNCTAEYFGPTCAEHVNPCAVNGTETHCLNEGTCYVDGVVARCHCTYQFTGERCETKKTQSYDLYFTSIGPPKRVSSIAFDGKLLKEFSLCAWINPDVRGIEQMLSETTQPPIISIFTSQQNSTDSHELLMISSSGVNLNSTLVATFDVKSRVWHHICVRYSSDEDVLTVMLDGQIAATSEINLQPITSQADILLGQNAEGDERFVGRVSLVQLYRRVLTDVEVRNMSYDCMRWLKWETDHHGADLIVKWKQFTSVGIHHHPAVYALYPGICVSSTCLPGHSGDCDGSPNGYDKIPPTVLQCPSNRHVVSSKRLVNVSWQPDAPEAIFSDNVRIRNVTSNYRSGDVFTWGEYRVIYIASDETGNLAKCQFEIVVAPSDCTDPPSPRNGNARIVNVTSEDARRVAFLDCDPGYIFADKMPAFFTCDIMGDWSRWKQTLQYHFPSCSAYKIPEQRLQGSVSIDDDCSHIADIEKLITARIAEANKKFGGTGFCATPNCTGEVKFSSPCGERRKRSPSPRIDVTYVLSVNTTRSAISSLIQSTMYEEFGNNARPPTTEWKCKDPQFQMLLRGELSSCVKCTVGYYLNESVCVACPENTYKDTEGNGPCVKCEEGKVTGTTGAIMASDCYSNCSPGSYYYRPSASCELCEVGTFQPEYGSIQCVPCDPGSTTSHTGASSADECNVTCSAGYYMGVNEACVSCPQGTYRPDNDQIVQCISCNLGFSTPHSASTSSGDCCVVNCPPGTSTNNNITGPVDQNDYQFSQICAQCSIGYYQDHWNQSACLWCGEGLTTLNPGAPSAIYCVISSVTAAPNTSIAPQEKHETPPWVTWLIVAIAGSTGALIVSALIVIYRNRLRNLLYCCKNPDLKTIATTDYYRDTAYTYPIVTTTISTATTAPQMVDVYNDIFTGLQKMADGSEDSRARDFEDVETTPRAGGLTVDTTLRAVEKYGPKAIGMDSSGFPIDSADYERLGYGRQNVEFSGGGSALDSAGRERPPSWTGPSTLRRRFEGISDPYFNESISSTNDWQGNRFPYNHISRRDIDAGLAHNYEEPAFYDARNGSEDDDDEDYFG